MWKNIIKRANIGATSKSTLATPIEQILEISPSNNAMPPTIQGEETLEGYKKRIHNLHQEMGQRAKEEFGPPERFKHVKGVDIDRLKPEQLPTLAQYAASPQGISDYHISQREHNLSELLESFSQAQLVIYSSIDEVERDLIPQPLWQYYRDYCRIMESQDFQKDTNGIPQIGLPPLSAWDTPETSPSPLKIPMFLKFVCLQLINNIDTKDI